MPARVPATVSRPPPLATQLPPRLFFGTPEQRVALARERFFEEGVRPSGLVPEPVIQSWTRCMEARRRPAEPIDFDPVTRSRLSSALARNRQLLQAASADLDQLDTALAGTSCKAILTCPEGIVVHATPTARGEGRVMPLAARLGVNLNEANLGTSAPGVTGKTGEVCVVYGAEHFFDSAQRMYCAAAPIRDAQGRVAAVLDLSSEAQVFRFDAVAMVRHYATVIENRLLEAQSHDHLLLRFQVSPSLIHTPLEGLAAVTPDGRVAWLNGTAASLLGGMRQPGDEASCEALIGLQVESLFALAHRGAAVPHGLPNRLAVWLVSHWNAAPKRIAHLAIPPLPGTEPSTPAIDADDPNPVPAALETSLGASGTPAPSATLDDARRLLIERTLARHGGNVSRAARELGVSRGLLYRRIRQPPPA